MHDYLGNFPIPAELLPERLRVLLEPVGTDPAARVEVSSFTEQDPYGPNCEVVQMVMAVVAEDGKALPPILHSDHGLVAYSVPSMGEKGCCRNFTPSVGGHDYVVASWGSGLFFTYSLAEKVWMTLGLTPRCIGNEHQRMVYDDLRLPEFGVAEGEISAQYYFTASRSIRWYMSNEYLRRYLWLRGARGVRQFYYQAKLPDSQQLRELMNGEVIRTLGEGTGWLDGDIRKDDGDYLLQVWATVEAVSSDLCPSQSADGLVWPGIAGPVTAVSARKMIAGPNVYLDDRFLERYEQNAFYESTPIHHGHYWGCNPSYSGQWTFSGCQRIGRNLITVPLRELYQGIPDREVIHAHAHVLAAEAIAHLDLAEEHIAAKSGRLVEQLLMLGDHLSRLAASLDINKSSQELFGLSREQVRDEGWWSYSQLAKLAQVAPLAMSQQSFLARCKSVHEVWQRLPNGFLKKLLEAAGVPKKKVADLGSLKLLEALLNILINLDTHEESVDAFKRTDEPEGWDKRSTGMAMLFVTNDLRIADAHDAVGAVLAKLQDRGFDTATLHQGYGRALDFVFDGVIDAFEALNTPLSRILAR
ncbi:hypothetical protein FAS41_24520 [Pseudomonas nicosulfuronedens]|uniref:Uncharacterized protein n=1 Tax=Pseudomonas nicosulfuronedens TaxID=2571105 RepID=A0A5R9QPS1_9PSED|nr:hypothetical protein [Pseudomonas nicosulfuronedens]TLX71767.1 hypothetical protein FAS41_24520 [Pseudomonas nicosulfuronedens]